MLEGVIFDLDGVIVDSHPAHKNAWRTFFNSIGRQVSEEDLQFVLEGRKREDILRHFLGDLSAEQVNHYGAAKEALFRNSVQELKTIDGLHEFLDQLIHAEIPIALASSASRHRAEYMLEELGLRPLFKAIVTGDDVVNGKPDPALFVLAAKGLAVNAVSALVCEDAVAGVQAAKNAGMRCLAIASNGRGPVLSKAGADMVIPDFTGIKLEVLKPLFAHAPIST
jgi:beta-phosphoglucomutase